MHTIEAASDRVRIETVPAVARPASGDGAATGDAPPTHRLPPLDQGDGTLGDRERLEYEWSRLYLRLALLFAPALLWLLYGSAANSAAARMTIVILGSAALVAALLLRRPDWLLRFQLAFRVLDAALITAVLVEANPVVGMAVFDPIYLLTVVAAAGTHRRRGALIASAASAVGLGAAHLALARATGTELDAGHWLAVVTMVCMFLIVGWAVAMLLDKSGRATARRERTWRTRLAARNAELERLAGELASANRELADRNSAVARDLRESEQRFRRLAENAPDVIYRFERVPTFRFTYLSPAITRLLGYTPEEHYRDPGLTRACCHPDDLPLLDEMGSDDPDPKTLIIRWLHRAGHVVWTEVRHVPILDAAGRVVAHEGIARDVTEHKLVEAQLVHDALHDPLTGLPNRALLLDRLGQAIHRRRRNPAARFALLFLDLDRFKVVNDSLGHGTGDRLLVTLAQRFGSCLRPVDTAARFGGDEFAVLLDSIDGAEDAMAVAERIQAALAEPFDLDGHDFYATASIGITLSEDDPARAPEQVLRDADAAMYRAKSSGKARAAVFEPSLQTRAASMLQMETYLRRAVERDELRLQYQPILSLATGEVAGFEALLRWQHPELGVVSPADFVPLAEESGLIVPIGLWVLRRACEQIRRWRALAPDRPTLTISVNLSARQFAQPDLIEQVSAILAETGVDAASLQLEITESAVMHDAEAAVRALARLRALGVRIEVDDFGTGYSSLSYLSRLPIDALKIDRSFVNDLESNGENAEIVRTILALARNLRLGAVAEGVETAAQVAILRELECAQAQGYFFSPPVDADTAGRLIARAVSA